MLRDLNMPMMAPQGGVGSSSELTWSDIPNATGGDIQTGRIVYVELNNDETCTKASAGKILQFIKEGFMPILKTHYLTPISVSTDFVPLRFLMSEFLGGITVYRLIDDSTTFYAYSDALDKLFSTVSR